MAGPQFAYCSCVTAGVGCLAQCMVGWCGAGIACRGPFRYRFLLLLPAHDAFIRCKARRNTTSSCFCIVSPVSEAREAASRIVTDVTRAADIVSGISLLFKKGALQHELVDLNQLIREMIVLLRNEAARQSVSVRSDLAEDLPWVMADRIQLQQVFMNLMLNGIDAMKDIGTARELTIRSQGVKDGQLLISVSDTGIGLPPQQAEQIFSAFFTTKPHGTGMGLAISRSIIETHGGRLWATTSDSGGGASFRFTLPGEVKSSGISALDEAHSQSA